MTRLVTLMALLFATAAAKASVDLPVYFIDNRPFIEVRIDGKGPFWFLLDTGSSVTTVSADLSLHLRLRPVRNGEGAGAGDKAISFKVVHVASLEVGPVSLGPLDAPAIDEKRLSQAVGFQRFDGVLGAEIFKDRVVTIDASRGMLSLVSEGQFRAPAGAVAIPFLLDENDMPVVQASVDGISGSFQVDTGDRSSLTLFGPFWRKYDLDQSFAPTVRAMTGFGVGGPISAILGRPKGFAIGDVAVPPPVTRLSLQRGGTFTRTDRAGSIGMGILKRFDMTFDYSNHVMWLSKRQAFDSPDRYDRSGLWLGLVEGNGLQVVAVTPDGPAAHAGVHAGDLIRNVAAIPATAANLFTIRRLLEEPHIRLISVSATRGLRRYHATLEMKDQISPPLVNSSFAHRLGIRND